MRSPGKVATASRLGPSPVRRGLTLLLTALLTVVLLQIGVASATTTHAPASAPLPKAAGAVPSAPRTQGSPCNSLKPTTPQPVLLPAVCVSPTTLCQPGTLPCSSLPAQAQVHLWVNASTNTSVLPWVQVVFVVETTLYDGVYDPSTGDYGSGTNGADPCNGPCEESDGVPFIINNIGQIAQGISQKNTGTTSSNHVTFSMVDYFSNYDPSDPGADDHDDGDGSEYNVDVSTFEPATTFASTVTTMATANPSTLFGGGCPGQGWNSATHLYCDSDFSDNFLSSSMITALYGALHGSGLGWVNNASTYHVVVWVGSTLPKDPSYKGYWCATYNDAANSCPDPTTTTEPSYKFSSGLTSPAGLTLANITALAQQEHVIIDAIDLPDGMDELASKDLVNSTAKTTYAQADVKDVLSAGCYLAQQTGGSWEGPTPKNSGIGFTCAAAPSGSGGAGNLTNTFRTSSNGNYAWANNPSLAWALTNINFPPFKFSYNVTGTMREGSFLFIPAENFSMGPGGFRYSCWHNGLNISSACQGAWSHSIGRGHGWSWPLADMYPGDIWSVVFNVSVNSNFPAALVNVSTPIDLCLNSTQWSGCAGTGGPPYSTVTYNNFTGAMVQQSFPPASVTIAPYNPGPRLSAVLVSPSSDQLNISASQTFSATPSCTGGGCPAGTSFTWSLNNSALGSLSATSGASVTFTAGPTAGVVTLFANGTLYSLTIQSSPVFITVLPQLASVAIAPTSATILNNTQLNVSAVPTCRGGTCPVGLTYAWSLNNTLGSLSASTGQNVVFTAGSKTGNVSVSLTAVFNGATAVGAPSIITISSTPPPPLSGVRVSPTSATIPAGSQTSFSATPICTGTCTGGAIYRWTLTNTSAGTLNSTLGSTVTFLANNQGGNTSLQVNVTLNGQSRSSGPIPITVTAPPPDLLTSVVVSPISASVPVGKTVTFTASPTCTSTCPTNITYLWVLSSYAAGTIGAATGPTVIFTAGAVAGADSIYANATLGGQTKTSVTVPISVTAVTPPSLQSVSIAPGAVSVAAGAVQQFTASLSCNGPCPSGAIYAWSLSNWLGTLDTYSGPAVNFTAGSFSGNISLFVNVSLNGVLRGTYAAILVNAPPPPPQPALVSLALNPVNVTLRPGQSQVFTVTPACTGAPCPSNLTFLWRLGSNLGTLGSGTTALNTYTAGTSTGAVVLTVTVVLGNRTVNASTTITIASSSHTTTGANGNNLTLYLIIAGAVAAAAVVALAAVMLRKRRRSSAEPPPSPSGTEDPWAQHFQNSGESPTPPEQ